MTNPELVTAHDLAQWATTLTSKSTVPRLVRRLILANASLTQAAVRAGEGTLLRGWDGLVEAGVADAHVPQGTSRWEIAAGQDPRRKAQSDYRNRTANPLGADPASTTFVVLTPRSWPGRDAWCEARKRKGCRADRAVMHSTRIGDSCRQPPGVRPGQTGSTGAVTRAGLGVRVGGPRRSV